MVDLVHAYSNRRDLADDLARTGLRLHAEAANTASQASMPVATPPRQWRIDERIGADGVATLVRLYAEGHTIKGLAQRYAIGTTSVKKLLRENGAIRKHSPSCC